MVASLNSIRKSSIKKLPMSENNGHPLIYIRSPNTRKMAGTIHWSRIYGFYWMPWNNLNTYIINGDGSLGRKFELR